MTEEAETSELAGLLRIAIDDFVAERTDSHGFSGLGLFADSLRISDEVHKRIFAGAIDLVVGEPGDNPTAFWQAIHLLVEKTGKLSEKLGERVIANLDATLREELDQEAATSRYYKFLVYVACGGRLSAPRLRDEKAFRANAPVLWYNLMVDIFEGSPLSIIDITLECLKSSPPQLTLKEIILRLNKYFVVLGKDFSRGMQEIAEALADSDREYFANKVKNRFDLTISRESAHIFSDTRSLEELVRRQVQEELPAALSLARFKMAQHAFSEKSKFKQLGITLQDIENYQKPAIFTDEELHETRMVPFRPNVTGGSLKIN